MKKRFGAKIFWVSFAMATLAPQIAGAQQVTPPHREHVRFSYRAVEGCPSKNDFLNRVRERDAEIIADDQAARTLSVTLESPLESPQKWRGSLHTEGIASGAATRTITGDTCESVAHSLAIFTAIALREGANDELPPAHPELAEPDNPSRPDGGFMPMAPPRRSPLALALGLHRGRFALTANESISMMNDGGRTLGTGIAGTYFFTDWLGLDVETDLLANLPFDANDGDANQALARILAHAEFETLHARGSLFGPTHGNVLDLFIKPGIGAILTRPRPKMFGDVLEHYSYEPNLLFDFGIGLRAFLTESFAVSAETDLLFYKQRNSDTLHYDGAPYPIDQAPYSGVSTIAVGPVGEIGFTWFLSGARKFPR